MTGDRIFALFNALALQVAGLGVLLFWSIGAVFLFTHTGGQFNHIAFSGFGRTLYLLYPVILIIFSILGWLLFYMRRDIVAVLTLSTPVGFMLLYYFVLIFPSGARV